MRRRNPAGAGKIKSSRSGVGAIYCTCLGCILLARGEKIMLDAVDSMQNGGKSQDLNFMSPLTRWESRIPNGIAGAKHVKSVYLSSLNRLSLLPDVAAYSSL